MRLKISDRAVSRIVSAAAASVPGTIGLGRSLERPAGRTYPRYDVIVDDVVGTCSIEAHIAVTWPSPVTDVAEAVRDSIIAWIEDATGLKATHVNVVVGPIVPGQRVLKSLATRPQLRAVKVPPLRVTHPVIKSSPVPLRPVTIIPRSQRKDPRVY